jgi:hypothetical protein
LAKWLKICKEIKKQITKTKNVLHQISTAIGLGIFFKHKNPANKEAKTVR